MTPKEKAKKLVLKFAFKGAQHEGEAKTFALIAVYEIIEQCQYSSFGGFSLYWNEVKKEIEKL